MISHNFLQLLLQHGASVDLPVAQTFYASNPLYAAIAHGHWPCVHALLRAGTNPDLASRGRNSSLFHLLVKKGADIDLMQMTWECGGSVWVKDKDGRFPHQMTEATTQSSHLLSLLQSKLQVWDNVNIAL